MSRSTSQRPSHVTASLPAFAGLDNLLARLAPILAIALCAVVLFDNLSVYPAFWFDEGYKANAARTLADHGYYATQSIDGFIPFDPGISGGPAETATVALSFKVFGVSVFAARLPAVIYGVVTLIALYGLLRARGARPALFATLAVLAFPGVHGVSLAMLSRQAIAEVPAIALLTSGLACYALSWRPERGRRAIWLLRIGAGMLFGLAILSRQQWALTFGPALLLLPLLRVWWTTAGATRRISPALVRNFIAEATPVILLGVIVIGWKVIELVAVPADIRALNAEMTLDATRTNLITGLWGRNLSGGAWLMVGIQAAAVGVTLLRYRLRIAPVPQDQRLLDAFMLAGVTLHTIWLALFSVGWPRYAFPGYFFALVLLANAAWDLARAWHARRQPAAAAPSNAAWLSVCALLIGITALNLGHDRTTSIQASEKMAAYVMTSVRPDARIETWEWEIGSLSRPEQFHFPDQRYLFAAIRMGSHDNQFIDLDYDLLRYRPDYLILGPFEALAQVYDRPTVARCFQPVVAFAPYTLFQRVGCD